MNSYMQAVLGDFLITSFELVILALFSYGNPLRKKITFLKALLLYVIAGMMIILATRQIDFAYLKFIIVFLMLTLLQIVIYDISCMKAILTISMYYSVILLSEVFFGAYTNVVFDIVEKHNYSFEVFLYVIIIKFMTMIILLVMKRFILTDYTDSESFPFILPSFIANISGLIVLVYLSLQMNDMIQNYSHPDLRIILFYVSMLIAISYICNIIIVKISFKKFEQKKRLGNENKIANLKLDYYENKLKDENIIRRMYHDMKNHMIILSNEKQDISYCEKMYDVISCYDDYINSGNPYADIILKDKLRDCHNYKIKAEIKLNMERLKLEPIEVCSLFGNLLDNAIESCVNLSESSERFIKVNSVVEGEYLIIKFENSVTDSIDANGLGRFTTKKDWQNHGLGLNIVKSIIIQNEGWYKVKTDNGKFIIVIAFPIENAK